MNLQESIRIILREESDKVMNMQSKILSQFRKQDQMERNEYSKFVQSEFGGDYERGAKEYAKIKNRNSDDIFGDKKRIREFILINFDFNTFSSKDWENYWLLSQHSDNHPEFQKKALNIIKQNLGEDNEYYEYLHDRISCRESGTQIYGTQNICKKSKMNLQENIRRILREETEGIDSFLDEISSKHNMSDELKDFVKRFIEESDCKRINFSRFKMGVMGLALESGVLINSVALNHPLPFLLFLIFHEVAHQYQFKKYGEDVMYDCYLGEISEREAAEFMKHTEEVADDFAFRKIRQLQKLNLIGPYTPPQMYKNVPIQQITMMISNYRNDMRRKNIDSPKKVSEYFYNMVKSEL